jgi:hypothetical protein
VATRKQRVRDTSLPRESDGKDFSAGVIERFDGFHTRLQGTSRWDRIVRSAQRYHSESKGRDDTKIQVGGAKGELTLIQPNHYRSIVQAQLNLVTQATPSHEVTANTTDAEAISHVKIGRGLLAQYQRLHGLDALRVRRAELALVTSEGFFHIPWDESAGAAFGMDGDGKRIVNEGDLTFDCVPLWHVAYDWMSKDPNRAREGIVRRPMNRWDAIARWPKRKDEILDAPAWGEDFGDGLGQLTELLHADDTYNDDYIAVYYYYSDKCADVRNGHQAIVLNADCKPLERSALKVPRPPLFRLAPCERVYGPGGHTNNFEVLPLVDAYAAQLSVILSNNATFAQQIIAAEEGSGVKPHHFGRGLTMMFYKSGTQPPTPLRLLATPDEVYEFADLLMRQAEMLGSVSSVNRGDVERSKGDSGSKSALFASVAQQMATSFFQGLARGDAEIGQYQIEANQMRASTPRMAMIAGKNNAYAAVEFTKADLSKVALVTVRSASPMRDTFEGRLELADRVVKMKGGPNTAAKYITGLDTGNFDQLNDPEESQEQLIVRENEELAEVKGEMPRVARADNHLAHIACHQEGLNSPSIRRDQKLAKRFNDHIDWHLNCLTPGHPLYAGDAILMATGQKPLPHHAKLAPPGDGATFTPPPMDPNAMPPGPAGDGGGPPGDGPSPGGDAPPDMSDVKSAVPGQPQLPSMPTNPATGRKAPTPPVGQMDAPIAGAQ